MEKTKNFRVFLESLHEYNITVSKDERGVLYSLSYSENPIWSYPGKTIISVMDDGADLHINPKLSKKIDYSELIELKIIFNFISSLSNTHNNQFEVIEVPQKPLLV